jgi:hypothetical protein
MNTKWSLRLIILPARSAYFLPCFAIQLKVKTVIMHPKNNDNQSAGVSCVKDILSSNIHKLLKISTLAMIKAISEKTSFLFFMETPDFLF